MSSDEISERLNSRLDRGQITQLPMGFANKMAPGVSEYILFSITLVFQEKEGLKPQKTMFLNIFKQI